MVATKSLLPVLFSSIALSLLSGCSNSPSASSGEIPGNDGTEIHAEGEASLLYFETKKSYLVRSLVTGRCLDANNGNGHAYMHNCDRGNPNHLFKFAGKEYFVFVPRVRESSAVDAGGGGLGAHVYLNTYPSKAGLNISWQAVKKGNAFQFRSRQGGRCMDAGGGWVGATVYMRDCDNGENPDLLWIIE